MTNDEARWLQTALAYGGSFIRTFAEACLRTDQDNEQILRPALRALMKKYPDYLNWSNEAVRPELKP
jgi:hypothetical protein